MSYLTPQQHPIQKHPCCFLYLIGQLAQGGQEQQLCYLLQSMDVNRYKPAVAVWNFRENDIHVSSLRSLGVPIHSFPETLPPLHKLASVRSLIKSLRPKLVHSYSFWTNFPAFIGTYGLHTTCVGSLRGNLTQLKNQTGPIVSTLSSRWPRDQIYNSVAAVENLSHHNQLFLPRRCLVVRNGIDLEKFHSVPLPTNRKVTLLGIGTLNAIKRWDRLLIATATLRKMGFDFLVKIIGDGPMRQQLQEQANTLKIDDCVSFLGARNDIATQLAQSSFLVHTSDYEGFPNAVMEAMACARAVVATDVGDIPQVIENEKSGFVVDRDDTRMLADRIKRLIINPSLCETMGTVGRKTAEREFSLTRLVSNTLSAYQTIGWEE